MIPHEQLSLAEIFSDFKENSKQTNPNFFPYWKAPLISISLFRFLLEIIFMHQQEDQEDIHYMQCFGH